MTIDRQRRIEGNLFRVSKDELAERDERDRLRKEATFAYLDAEFKARHADLIDELRSAGHEPITKMVLKHTETGQMVNARLLCPQCGEVWAGKLLSGWLGLVSGFGGLSPSRPCEGASTGQ